MDREFTVGQVNQLSQKFSFLLEMRYLAHVNGLHRIPNRAMFPIWDWRRMNVLPDILLTIIYQLVGLLYVRYALHTSRLQRYTARSSEGSRLQLPGCRTDLSSWKQE